MDYNDKIKVLSTRAHILEMRDAAVNRNIINKIMRKIRKLQKALDEGRNMSEASELSSLFLR